MIDQPAPQPTAPEEQSAWSRWLDQMQNDPNTQQALLQFAAANLRSRQPGESTLSVFGDALGQSLKYYQGLKQNDANNARKDAELDLKKKDVESTVDTREEDIAASAQNRKQKEDLHTGNLQNQQEDIASKKQNRVLKNEDNTRAAESEGARVDLMRAQAENLRARTDAAKSNGVMPAASVQELSLRAKNLMDLAAQKGQQMTEAEALDLAFQKLSDKNPELWDRDLYLRAFNLKGGESGAIFGQGSTLQQSTIQAGNQVTNQSFTKPLPLTVNAQGMQTINIQAIDPNALYQTAQGTLSGADIIQRKQQEQQAQQQLGQQAPLPTN